MRGTTSDTRPVPKLLGLELVRLGCALAVLVWHYSHFTQMGAGVPVVGSAQPMRWLLAPFYDYGKLGVQLFWCISGFIFYWKYSAPLAERQIDGRTFFWLRFSRLYPLHFVTLLSVAALQPIYVALVGDSFVYDGNDAGHFMLQLLMADQWFGARALSFNGPIWSVSAEVFVYVAFFLAVRIFGRSWWVVLCAMASGALSIVADIGSPALICGAYFFAGGAAAMLFQDTGRQRLWQGVAMALLVVAGVLAKVVDLRDVDGPPLALWLLLAAPPGLLLIARDWRFLARWQGGIAAAGNLTYSTYLIHFPLQLASVIVMIAWGLTPPIGSPGFLIAYLGVTLILGRIVYTRFEAPAQQAIRRIMLGPSRERSAA